MSATRPDTRVLCRDFSPGFRDGPEADTLAPGASPSAKNTIFASVDTGARRAVIQRRPGSSLLDSATMGAAKAVDALFSFPKTGQADILCAVCNGKLFTFDVGTDAWVQVGATAPWTAGNAARVEFFRNQAYIFDGAAQKRFNGTALLDVGFVAPTAAPALANVAPTGTGLTGTYEGFAVWYDSVTDHESDRSAISAAVALANEARQWTKPTGSPPANVTHWRIYCRRTDTSEANYYRAATVAVGTATVTEQVIDTARRELGPKPNVNGVPPVFAFMAMWKGYGLGVPLDSASFYAMKLNDPEGSNPTDVFLVQRNRAIRAIRTYGTQCLVQTDEQSFYLEGSAIPFAIQDLHSEYGCVSQDAAVEVDGWYYAWDRKRGPYRTNTVDWQPLGETPIAATLENISKLHLAGIRAAYYPDLKIVLWAVPGTSARRQTLLAWHVTLEAWLPPITGLEYASITTHLDADSGAVRLYAGDYAGRAWRLLTGTDDAPATGDTTATITAATAGSITAAAATFFTTGAGLAGVSAVAVSPAGVTQWVRIASNTGTALTLDTTNGPELDPVPAAGWTVYIGAIDWYWWTPLADFGDPTRKKTAYFLDVQAETATDGDTVDVGVYLDGSQASAKTVALELPVSESGLIWGAGIWGVDTWAGPAVGRRVPRKHRIWRGCHQVQLRFRNYRPGETVTIFAYAISADWTSGRSPSA